MSGFLTNGIIAAATFSGREESPWDVNPTSAGALPLQEKIALYKLAAMMTCMTNTLNKTMVAGTIYYSQINIGATYTPTPLGSGISEESFTLNGINIPVGTTGGTDTWYVALYNSAGVVVGLCATAGVTAGTASTIQQIPFYGSAGTGGAASPITVTSGTYYMALQSSGTTATFKSINSPIWPYNTGSQTGVAGTLAAISAVSTTYTANLGPMATLY